jgi:hypothetical protein
MNLKKIGMRKLFVLALVLTLTFFFVACGGGASLVGKWVLEEGQDISGVSARKTLEISKDGTGISDNFTLTWTAEKGRLTLWFYGGVGYEYGYKLSGSTLVLTTDGGSLISYKKE